MHMTHSARCPKAHKSFKPALLHSPRPAKENQTHKANLWACQTQQYWSALFIGVLSCSSRGVHHKCILREQSCINLQVLANSLQVTDGSRRRDISKCRVFRLVSRERHGLGLLLLGLQNQLMESGLKPIPLGRTSGTPTNRSFNEWSRRQNFAWPPCRCTLSRRRDNSHNPVSFTTKSALATGRAGTDSFHVSKGRASC